MSRDGRIDVLRFGVSVFIVAAHFAPPAAWGLFPFLNLHWVGTDLFILLSGFVLTRAYKPAKTWFRFMWDRLRRIYPSHVLVMMAFAPAYLVGAMLGIHPPGYSAWAIENWGPNLLLTHAWGLGGVEGWNEPSWTLSALVVAYAAFPFLVRLPTILLFLPALLAPWLWDAPHEIGVLRIIPLFPLGIALARVLPTRGAKSTALTSRLDRISFSLYITHWLLQMTAARTLDSFVGWVALILAAIVLAAVWDRWVDGPIQKLRFQFPQLKTKTLAASGSIHFAAEPTPPARSTASIGS